MMSELALHKCHSILIVSHLDCSVRKKTRGQLLSVSMVMETLLWVRGPEFENTSVNSRLQYLEYVINRRKSFKGVGESVQHFSNSCNLKDEYYHCLKVMLQ